MEISGNSFNKPVSFYSKNTENNINTLVESENNLYRANIFAPEFQKKAEKTLTLPFRKKRKNKRLNTIDTDYLPDETEETEIKADNIFLENEQNLIMKNLKKTYEYFITSIPLINYFFLKEKQQKIKKTVEKLSDISQNMDELLNTASPYGEEEAMYENIAENLTTAATIIVEENKNN